ncbi:MAG TPA: hypothetical protein ENJ28_12135 [Gammaproteobacteria bacterium]|nr:hypothetical protein [Gammaproteobacteria bacterium]
MYGPPSQSQKHQALEEYFAKKYTKKYVELGGYFGIKPLWPFSKSPMEKYFLSGQYVELNDKKLDDLWIAVKWNNFYTKIFIIFILLASFISWLLK